MLSLVLLLSLNSTAYRTWDPVRDHDPNKLIFEMSQEEFPLVLETDSTVSPAVMMATQNAMAYWTFHLGFKPFAFDHDDMKKTSRHVLITTCPECQVTCENCEGNYGAVATKHLIKVNPFADPRDLERIMIHEVGHILGLPHVSDLDYDNIMCHYVPARTYGTGVTNQQVNLVRKAVGLKPTKYEVK